MCDALGRHDINIPIKDIPRWESCFSSIVDNFIACELQGLKFQAGEIFNSCRAIEGYFLELVANDINVQGEKKMWAVFPYIK